jgi:3-oxoacyl-[acyl-carrier protein] reductase
MDLNLTNRVALVTGAGGGLGGAIAQRLAQEGARVVACDVAEEALSANIQGSDIRSHVFDLSDLDAMDAVVDDVIDSVGPIDVLVNITGGPPATTVAGNPSDVWRTHFDAMITPVVHLTDRVLPGMRERGWGRVVTSTSSGVVAPIKNLGLSNSLRSALVGWSKTLSTEVGRDGVTVNTVIPGRIHTPRIDQLDQAKAEREGRTVEAVAEESTASIPVGRYGRPEEYADAVAFLCSDRASYITGSSIRVDGGLIPSV